MRFMLLLKGDPVGELPSSELIGAMISYQEELTKAGVLLAAEGLHDSSFGARVVYDSSTGRKTVVDGPFTEAKELVGGFWILQVDSLADALSWARRAPFRNGERLEVRRVSEAEDFEGIAPPEVLEQEAELRARTSQQHGG
jgi:hypothetical protein